MEIFTEQYRPRKVADFIGLSKPKEKMLSLIARPRSSAWLMKEIEQQHPRVFDGAGIINFVDAHLFML